MSRLALGPTHPPIQWVAEAKRPDHEVDHLCPSCAIVRNEQNCMFASLVFLCSVDRDRCACTFMILTLTVWISILGVIPRSCAAEYGQRYAMGLNISVTLLQLHQRWWLHAFKHPPRLACHNLHHLLDHLKCIPALQRWNVVKGRCVWKCVCVSVCLPCVIRIIHFVSVRPFVVFNLTNVSFVLIGAKM